MKNQEVFDLKNGIYAIDPNDNMSASADSPGGTSLNTPLDEQAQLLEDSFQLCLLIERSIQR